jgi:hypothetical protein
MRTAYFAPCDKTTPLRKTRATLSIAPDIGKRHTRSPPNTPRFLGLRRPNLPWGR